MLGKPRILSFSPTCLINSIKREHSCKILYIFRLFLFLVLMLFTISSCQGRYHVCCYIDGHVSRSLKVKHFVLTSQPKHMRRVFLAPRYMLKLMDEKIITLLYIILFTHIK